MDRNLDGVYFRIKRNDKYENVCFSDLTNEQQEEVLSGRNEEWLKRMCIILANTIKNIGDELDLVKE